MFDSLKLYHCGTMKLPLSMLIDAEERDLVDMPFLALAGYHEEHGLVLVDAPYGHDGPKNIGGVLGTLIASSVMRFKPSWSVIPRIEQMGWRPSLVDHVLMTHMHYDHTGGMKELGHATFHVSQKEWKAATTVGAFDGLIKGYAISDYRALHAKMDLFDTEESYDRASPGHDIFGDGSVCAIALPGHTAGHVGYLFSMRDGRKIFHVGDAIYDRRQLTANAGLGSMAKRVSANTSEALFTINELRRFTREHPEVEILCAHDESLGERCAKGPVKL